MLRANLVGAATGGFLFNALLMIGKMGTGFSLPNSMKGVMSYSSMPISSHKRGLSEDLQE